MEKKHTTPNPVLYLPRQPGETTLEILEAIIGKKTVMERLEELTGGRKTVLEQLKETMVLDNSWPE